MRMFKKIKLTKLRIFERTSGQGFFIGIINAKSPLAALKKLKKLGLKNIGAIK